MPQNERELMRHDAQADLPVGRTAPPPFTKPPDMAETLRLLEKVSRMPEIRFDKVQQARDLIARGEYETPERIDGTVDRLMEDLGL